MDEKNLISQISNLTKKKWGEESEPLLISNIPRHLADTDFRSVLGNEGLKSFVLRTRSEGGYQLVEDPEHKARIGIIPDGEAYDFPVSGQQPISEDKHKGATMMKFLDLLGQLSEEEQRSVVIPVNVITKLLQK